MITNNAIIAHLSKPEFYPLRDAVKDGIMRWANNEFAGWMKDVLVIDVTLRNMDLMRKIPRGVITSYINCNREIDYNNFIERIKAAHEGAYSLNIEKLEKLAADNWDDDKAFYAARVSEKIVALLGETEWLRYNLTLRGNKLVGTVTAIENNEPDCKQLVLQTSLITNYRYGQNAANGSLTVYRQIPTTIVSSYGFDAVAKEREILAAAEQAKQTAKEEKKAKAEQIDMLKRRKEKLNDVLDAHKWIHEYLMYHGENGTDYVSKYRLKIKNLLTELEIPETTTIPEIRLMIKEILAKIRFLKGK